MRESRLQVPFLYFRNGKPFAIPRSTALKHERVEFFGCAASAPLICKWKLLSMAP
jgi:hypothetical protein